MPRTSYALAGALLFLVSPSSVSALTMTQTQGLVSKPNYSLPVEFNKFDPNLGTLTSVSYRMDLSIDGGSLTVDNDGPLDATVNVDLGAMAAISSVDVKLLDTNLNPILSGANELGIATGSTFTLKADNGDGANFDPGAPDAATHTGGVAATFSEANLNSLFLSDYVGTGTFEILVKVDQLLDFGGIGGISGQFDPVQAETKVWVTYNYEPIPEPSSMGLGGLALLAGWNIRRGRRRAA